MTWIALFSQTGTEIYRLIQQTGKLPAQILTNRRPDQLDGVNKAFLEQYGHLVTHLPFRPCSNDYFKAIGDQEVVITLHGFLRILPADVCKKYLIFNGHPALITKYPELRGKDRQEDVYTYKEKYPTIGTVIHRVTAELDAGEIIMANEQPNTVTNVQEAYSTLYEMSLSLWLDFFRRYGGCLFA